VERLSDHFLQAVAAVKLHQRRVGIEKSPVAVEDVGEILDAGKQGLVGARKAVAVLQDLLALLLGLAPRGDVEQHAYEARRLALGVELDRAAGDHPARLGAAEDAVFRLERRALLYGLAQALHAQRAVFGMD